MQQPHPATHYVSKPPTWLWMLPVFSMGLLAFVPPIVIATKARTRRAWWWAGGLAALWLAGFATIGSGPDGSESSTSTHAASWVGSSTPRTWSTSPVSSRAPSTASGTASS